MKASDRIYFTDRIYFACNDDAACRKCDCTGVNVEYLKIMSYYGRTRLYGWGFSVL